MERNDRLLYFQLETREVNFLPMKNWVLLLDDVFWTKQEGAVYRTLQHFVEPAENGIKEGRTKHLWDLWKYRVSNTRIKKSNAWREVEFIEQKVVTTRVSIGHPSMLIRATQKIKQKENAVVNSSPKMKCSPNASTLLRSPDYLSSNPKWRTSRKESSMQPYQRPF